MYHPIEGGTPVVIEGLTCWIPPAPPHKEIANWHLPKEEQFWRRTPLPDWYEDKYEEEEERREELVKEFGSIATLNRMLESGKIAWQDRFDYVDPQCEAFRQQEWSRRMNGFWFYNNGKPTYLTGANYYYLNWIQIDTGYPQYYDFTRENFYFCQYCEEDPHCLGYLLIAGRGIGKTIEQLVMQLEKQTRKYVDHTGAGLTLQEYSAAIQSKTQADANDLFEEKIVNMFNSLPHFFKPVYDTGKGTTPSAGSGLRFYRPSVRGKNAKKVKFQDGEELKSSIKPFPAGDKALDGKSLVDVFMDEIGKTKKDVANVYKRILVNRQVVFRNHRKYGIMRATTTVEQMDEGGAECYEVWKNSDQNERSANGFTITGMYRRFLSCIRTHTGYIDKYGKVDEAKAELWHQAECKLRENDPTTLADFLRKNPKYIEHAFYVNAANCPFNQMILQNNKAYIASLENPVGRFRLDWTGVPYESDVVANRDERGGHWYMSELPKKEHQNKVRENGFNRYGKKQFKPLNGDMFAGGSDPIDLAKVVDEGRASFPAILIKKRLNPHEEDPHPRNLEIGADLIRHNTVQDYLSDRPLLQWRRDSQYQYKTGIYVALYAFRPTDPEIYYEELIKACRYFGTPIHIESQKGQSCKMFMDIHGYGEFVSKKWVASADLAELKKAEEYSMTASGVGTINSYINLLATYIEYFGHTIKFTKLTDQLLKTNPSGDGMKKLDVVVAAGFTELEDSRPMKPKRADINIGSFFPKNIGGIMTWGK